MQKWIQSLIHSKKIAFLGAGNLSRAIVHGLVTSSTVTADNILLSNRNPEKTEKLKSEFPNIEVLESNEDLLERAGIIVLGVKPQDLIAAIEPLRHLFHEDHIIISLAAGVNLAALKSLIPSVKQIIRWMPSTNINVQESVTAYVALNDDETLLQLSDALLSPLGLAVQVEEGDEMDAVMVACASGPAFIYEFMQIWVSWLDSYGIPDHIAKQLAIQTFLGSAELAKTKSNLSLNDLQNQVMSKKGVTFSGIKHFRSLEFENLLNSSFEKSMQRAKEMEKDFFIEMQHLNKK